MIHPDTILKNVNPTIGLGVFATKLIPKGTIVYVVDELDLKIQPDNPLIFDSTYSKTIEHYSYMDENGVRIISWDHAKYVNHSCDFNTISTGYGFEIAVRDILPREQITDEYAVLNIEYEMDLECGCTNCRKRLKLTDFDNYYSAWDAIIQPSLSFINEVEQPLMKYMDKKTKKELLRYLKTGKDYKSVYTLKY